MDLARLLSPENLAGGASALADAAPAPGRRTLTQSLGTIGGLQPLLAPLLQLLGGGSGDPAQMLQGLLGSGDPGQMLQRLLGGLGGQATQALQQLGTGVPGMDQALPLIAHAIPNLDGSGE